uniref:Tetraspanin-18 n=1 Tax=Kalanchoe fedtschenkoi TaxID=63787 RepID=A0A7N0U8Z5_KALFE
MPTYCRSFLAFVLKFLIFLQTSIGVCMIMYSLFMLDQRDRHAVPDIPALPPAAASPAPSSPMLLNLGNYRAILGVEMVSGMDDEIGLIFSKLPAPWFIYAFMGMGILTLCISCIGHIAAEAINGCCLSLYSLLITIFLLLEAVCVSFIALNHHWKEDLPYDPTGELHDLLSFIETNQDIFKWVGFVELIIQAMSLLLAFALSAMVSTQSEEDYDCEEGNYYDGRGRSSLVSPQSSQLHGSALTNSRNYFSEIWSSRMRGKYGLNSSGTEYVSLNQQLQ